MPMNLPKSTDNGRSMIAKGDISIFIFFLAHLFDLLLLKFTVFAPSKLEIHVTYDLYLSYAHLS
jgi:hypothetical protein